MKLPAARRPLLREAEGRVGQAGRGLAVAEVKADICDNCEIIIIVIGIIAIIISMINR